MHRGKGVRGGGDDGRGRGRELKSSPLHSSRFLRFSLCSFFPCVSTNPRCRSERRKVERRRESESDEGSNEERQTHVWRRVDGCSTGRRGGVGLVHVRVCVCSLVVSSPSPLPSVLSRSSFSLSFPPLLSLDTTAPFGGARRIRGSTTQPPPPHTHTHTLTSVLIEID